VTAGTLLIVAETLGGGLGAATLSHAGWFSERGWRVVVTASPTEVGPPPGMTFVPLPIPTTARDVVGMRQAWRVIRFIVRTEHPDVVHCHGLRSFALGRLASTTAPFVTLHGSGIIASAPHGYETLRNFGRAVIPHLARGAVTAAPEFGGGWRFLPHASPRLAGMARHAFPPPGGRPLFLWIGRLDEPKDSVTFVRALTAAARTREVRGVVAGRGAQRVLLERLIADEGAPVELLGVRDDVEELIAQAWGLVVLSHFEGVTFAAQEAMWAGRPVIASPLPGLTWLVGDAGLFAADLASATDAIVRLSDRETASRLGDRSAERIRSLIRPDDPWPAIEALYSGREP
jgi:glycosyltransferase involved in cell wall biosynthesis